MQSTLRLGRYKKTTTKEKSINRWKKHGHSLRRIRCTVKTLHTSRSNPNYFLLYFPISSRFQTTIFFQFYLVIIIIIFFFGSITWMHINTHHTHQWARRRADITTNGHWICKNALFQLVWRNNQACLNAIKTIVNSFLMWEDYNSIPMGHPTAPQLNILQVIWR